MRKPLTPRPAPRYTLPVDTTPTTTEQDAHKMSIERYTTWIRLAFQVISYILSLLLSNGGAEDLAKIVKGEEPNPPTRHV